MDKICRTRALVQAISSFLGQADQTEQAALDSQWGSRAGCAAAAPQASTAPRNPHFQASARREQMMEPETLTSPPQQQQQPSTLVHRLASLERLLPYPVSLLAVVQSDGAVASHADSTTTAARP
eukprot:g78071.t1